MTAEDWADAAAWRPLMVSIARRYVRGDLNGHTPEDVASEALFFIGRSVGAVRAGRCSRLHAIRVAVIAAIRAIAGRGGHRVEPRGVRIEGRDRPSHADPAAQMVADDLAAGAARLVPPNVRPALPLLAAGLTPSEAGRALGKSRMYVAKMLGRSQPELRAWFQRQGVAA